MLTTILLTALFLVAALISSVALMSGPRRHR
ncbi:archaellin [Spirilliplanes yamanashiensis]|nr:archaellin [Spirilliplanes yamanashiensis]